MIEPIYPDRWIEQHAGAISRAMHPLSQKLSVRHVARPMMEHALRDQPVHHRGPAKQRGEHAED